MSSNIHKNKQKTPRNGTLQKKTAKGARQSLAAEGKKVLRSVTVKKKLKTQEQTAIPFGRRTRGGLQMRRGAPEESVWWWDEVYAVAVPEVKAEPGQSRRKAAREKHGGTKTQGRPTAAEELFKEEKQNTRTPDSSVPQHKKQRGRQTIIQLQAQPSSRVPSQKGYI